MAKPMSAVSANILKKLDTGTLAMNDLFDFLMSGAITDRHYRLGKEEYKAFKRRSWQRRVAMNAEHQATEDKQKFYNLMYRLSEQGLVKKEKRGIKTMLSITQKGKEKFRDFKKYFTAGKYEQHPVMPSTHHPKTKSASSIIISFDIPEKEKYKRAWLRSALRNLDYTILHESVWIGSNTLPKELLDECRHLNMTKYIHIFSVLKKGTISE